MAKVWVQDMRLVCPNCGAQYEVPRGVIPDEGRDVQCSNCGHTWFEPHPDAVAAEPPAAPPMPDPEPQPEPARVPAPEPETYYEDSDDSGFIPPEEPPQSFTEPQPARVDPSVADVLREERAFEERAREADALESQPDLGLDELVQDEADGEARRAREAQERKARIRGQSVAPAEAAVAATMAAEAARPRRDQLPDIDDINDTLRSTKEPRITDRTDPPPHMQAADNERRSFRRGFFLMVLIAVALVALYVFAPRIAEAVPQLAGPLESYVGFVDQARLWLDAQVANAVSWLDSMASESAAPDAEQPAPAADQ